MKTQKPKVIVKLSGPDGNAFALMGKVAEAMKKSGQTKEQIKEFSDKAMSGDYENLLRVVREHVDLVTL